MQLILDECKCTAVVCQFTVDNVITSVSYNGIPLQVSGPLNDWRKENLIQFESCDDRRPGELRIKGFDWNNSLHCYRGGLMLHCRAGRHSSPWHNFVSDTAHWKDENGAKPCQNDLLYGLGYQFIKMLKTEGARKIWSNRKNVTLIGKP